MGKVTVDFSMSLDGFVAGPKQTLEQALGEGGERLHEWAFAAASFRENHGLPGGIGAALEQARAAAGDKDVLVAGGANVVQQYLKAGLLDELQIHVVPVLLGDGVRLLENHLGAGQVALECTRVIESPTGVAHLRYRVVK